MTDDAERREALLDFMSGARGKFAADAIGRMRFISAMFYREAVALGVHAFIEHTGMMNEHINILAKAVKAGVDITHINVHSGPASVRMTTHEAEYLGEKFACVWSAMMDRRAWEAFKRVVDREIVDNVSDTR